MVEPEVAFIDQEELMDLEEDFIKYCVKWALDNCKDDLAFLNKMIDKTLIERLEGVLKETFVRLPYTEGINILQGAIKNGKKFDPLCFKSSIARRTVDLDMDRSFAILLSDGQHCPCALARFAR